MTVIEEMRFKEIGSKLKKFWISVDDKLPPKNIIVLIVVAHSDGDDFCDVGLLNKFGNWMMAFEERLTQNPVIYWMPLPSPPRLTYMNRFGNNYKNCRNPSNDAQQTKPPKMVASAAGGELNDKLA